MNTIPAVLLIDDHNEHNYLNKIIYYPSLIFYIWILGTTLTIFYVVESSINMIFK